MGAGEHVAVLADPHEGRELKFTLQHAAGSRQQAAGEELKFTLQRDDALRHPHGEPAAAPQQQRAHAPWFESLPPAESPADVGPAPRGAADRRRAESCRARLSARLVSDGGTLGGCARRACSCESFRRRKPRAPLPGAPVAADGAWAAALGAAS